MTFIHGLGGAANSFAPLITASGAESTHRIILIDLPGHGLSQAAVLQFSIDQLASSIGGVLEHFGVTKTILIGHSMGGVSSSLASCYTHANANVAAKYDFGESETYPYLETGYIEPRGNFRR